MYIIYCCQTDEWLTLLFSAADWLGLSRAHLAFIVREADLLEPAI